MQYVIVELGPVVVPMIETEDGQLLTTAQQVAKAVGSSESAICSLVHNNQKRFSSASAQTNTHAESLWAFGPGHLFLTDDDVLEVALLSGDLEFRDRFKTFLKTKKSTVSK